MRLALAVSILMVTLAGCGRTEFLYNNADWFIENWADDLLQLDTAQASAWRPYLNEAIDRHREIELPQIVRFLATAELHAGSGTSVAISDCLVGRAEALYRRHARLAAELAVPVLHGLRTEQVEDLERRLDEKNADYRKKYLTPDNARREQERTERYTERYERWTGPLNAAQRKLISLTVTQTPDTATPWLAYRQIQQARLLQLLRDGADRQDLHTFLVSWWVRLSDRSAALENAMAALRRDTVHMIHRLYVSLSPQQILELVDRIRELKLDLIALLPADATRLADNGVSIACLLQIPDETPYAQYSIWSWRSTCCCAINDWWHSG